MNGLSWPLGAAAQAIAGYQPNMVIAVAISGVAAFFTSIFMTVLLCLWLSTDWVSKSSSPIGLYWGVRKRDRIGYRLDPVSIAAGIERHSECGSVTEANQAAN
jgi:hypothetical protein